MSPGDASVKEEGAGRGGGGLGWGVQEGSQSWERGTRCPQAPHPRARLGVPPQPSPPPRPAPVRDVSAKAT